MVAITGKTTMSSRGQVVIPKALRETAGIAEGDELEVAFDGERLTLARVPGGVAAEEAACGSEAQAGYATGAGGTAAGTPVPLRLSQIWADRIRALAAIERLRPEFEGLSFDELWSKARRERKGGDVDG